MDRKKKLVAAKTEENEKEAGKQKSCTSMRSALYLQKKQNMERNILFIVKHELAIDELIKGPFQAGESLVLHILNIRICIAR